MAYALDANVFIEAFRRYYAFPICPGFWNSLIHLHTQNSIFSIDRVKAELVGKGDELSVWAAEHVLNGCFEPSDTPPITAAYGGLVAWVNGQPQFTPAAKAEFSDKPDAWLIAYAQTTGRILVTHEILNVDARRRVPIPNVCNAFGIPYVDTFEMLRSVGAAYHWTAP